MPRYRNLGNVYPVQQEKARLDLNAMPVGTCAADIFPKMRRLQINVCISRANKPGLLIKESSNVLETIKETIPEILTDLQEHFVVLILNTKNRVVGVHHMAIGTINSTLVDPRIVFQPAVVLGANAIIIVHNHPSGDTTPSSEDYALTKRLKEVGTILGIKVLDSIIVARTPGGSYIHHSLVDDGMMP